MSGAASDLIGDGPRADAADAVGGEVASWWAELLATALVGTSRHPAPVPRPVAGAHPPADLGPERAVLDGAAIAGVARAAGLIVDRDRAAVPPAPPDDRPVAPRAAAQMLELLLEQAPALGSQRDDLLRHWYETCDGSGCRIPEDLLVRVLDSTVGLRSSLRDPVRAVLGERGRWLGKHNPAWSWAAGDAAADGAAARDDLVMDETTWAQLPAAERLTTLTRLRSVAPARARELLVSTWSSDAAPTRRAHLAVLADGLGPEDEALLERALDDRAKAVREVAASLLDGLPTSARAARMAARLAPLVSVAGRWRGRTISVELPDTGGADPADPDDAHDGLGAAPKGRSARGWRLERIVAGTPLSFWTELTGDDPAAVLEHVDDDDVRAGLLAAALAQRDSAWALALFARSRDPRLLALVAPGERDDAVRRALRARSDPAVLGRLLAEVPTPWSARLSREVVAIVREAPNAMVLHHLAGEIAAGLDAAAVAELESWLAALQRQDAPPAPTVTALRAILQHRSLHRSITEAFA